MARVAPIPANEAKTGRVGVTSVCEPNGIEFRSERKRWSNRIGAIRFSPQRVADRVTTHRPRADVRSRSLHGNLTGCKGTNGAAVLEAKGFARPRRAAGSNGILHEGEPPRRPRVSDSRFESYGRSRGFV